MSLKRSYALFLLFIFLTPSVQREWHAFAHKDERSCEATHSKHLHVQHHYCKFCDFSIPFNAELIDNQLITVNFHFDGELVSPQFGSSPVFALRQYAPRAPPVTVG
ncbi:MAG TPA: hypothetical protein VFW78_00885 [Bacteroidia bacterium]|nr:hypothetical protein [Bacteroidia bacterium]